MITRKSSISNILIIILFASPVSTLQLAKAQNQPITKANYALAARFSPDNVDKMVFSTWFRPNWLETGDKFWYSYKTSEGTFYYIVDPEKKSKKYLFDNHEMARMLTLITKDPYDYQHLPFINPKFKKGDNTFEFTISNSERRTFHLEYNIQTGKLYENKDWKEEKRLGWMNISPDSSYCVYAKNHNFFCMDKLNYLKALKNENDTTLVEQQLTTDGVEYNSYGDYPMSAYYVGMNDDEQKIKEERKMRRAVYIVWSQDSKKFVTTKKDEREIKFLWVINSLENPRPTLDAYKWPMPGESDPTEAELLVFTIHSKKVDTINVKKFANQQLNILTERDEIGTVKGLPSKNNDALYFTRQSRDFKKWDFCLANFKTGEVKVLIEERMNTYLTELVPKLINGGKEIIFISERDGWAHLYLYDDKGNVKNQITSGPWQCNAAYFYPDERARVVYFMANGREKGEDIYYSHFYKVNFDGTGLTLLNKGDYNHFVVSLSKSKKYFVDNYSKVNSIPKTALRDNNGNTVMDLETADLSNLMASGYKFPEPFKVKAADGITDIYGVMYKPYDFDSTKSYPTIEYIYPGPQMEEVAKIFNFNTTNTDRLAQLGFIIVTLGNRGSNPLRSKWYHNYSYGDLRDLGLADLKYGLEQLADKYKFIDINKVGIMGASSGGNASAAAICQYPDFYKVAVSTSGDHDNNIYHPLWAEKYQGVKEVIDPKDSSSKFVWETETNPQIAANLKGKLLLITGDVDNNVNPAHTYRMVDALVKANKRFDMFVMPGQEHSFDSHYLEYFFWIYADYFSKHLIGDDSHLGSTDVIEMRKDHKMTASKMRAE